jgi:hypothetical protein
VLLVDEDVGDGGLAGQVAKRGLDGASVVLGVTVSDSFRPNALLHCTSPRHLKCVVGELERAFESRNCTYQLGPTQ